MRKTNSLFAFAALMILTTVYDAKAQSTKGTGPLANRRLNNTDFLGWDNGVGGNCWL